MSDIFEEEALKQALNNAVTVGDYKQEPIKFDTFSYAEEGKCYCGISSVLLEDEEIQCASFVMGVLKNASINESKNLDLALNFNVHFMYDSLVVFAYKNEAAI